MKLSQYNKSTGEILMSVVQEQIHICRKYNASYLECSPSQKLGISINVKEKPKPLNGLRLKPEGDTTGWYIWGGEVLLEDPDFFVPLHVDHIDEWDSRVKKYLGLAPGWRFLITDEYEDVWFDEDLLKGNNSF